MFGANRRNRAGFQPFFLEGLCPGALPQAGMGAGLWPSLVGGGLVFRGVAPGWYGNGPKTIIEGPTVRAIVVESHCSNSAIQESFVIGAFDRRKRGFGPIFLSVTSFAVHQTHEDPLALAV